MLIPEKYRERYDALAHSHPWMREMRDEQLPEGDAVAILRRVASNQDSPPDCALVRYTGVSDGMSASIAETHRALNNLADMVERDYVHRVDYEDLRDEFVWTNAFLHRVGKKCGTEDVPSLKAYVEKLESELDQWKKLTANIELPDYPLTQFQPKDKDRRIAELTAELDELKHERDEWKAKAETSAYKSTKRAAAVERMRGMSLDTGSAIKKIAIALGVRWNPDNSRASMSALQNTLIDLLADDESRGQDADQGERANEADCESHGTITAKRLNSQSIAQESGEIAENDAAKCEIRDFDDTREKLEADVREWVKRHAVLPKSREREFVGWLDRQAAITTSECERICDTCEWPSLAAMPDREAYDRITELETEIAKRDKGIERLRRRRDELIEEVKRLNAERKGMTHLEWMYRHDAWLRDELEQNYGLTEERLMSEHEDGSVVA